MLYSAAPHSFQWFHVSADTIADMPFLCAAPPSSAARENGPTQKAEDLLGNGADAGLRKAFEAMFELSADNEALKFYAGVAAAKGTSPPQDALDVIVMATNIQASNDRGTRSESLRESPLTRAELLAFFGLETFFGVFNVTPRSTAWSSAMELSYNGISPKLVMPFKR